MAGADDEEITVDLEMRGYLAEGAETAARAMDNLASNTKQANRQLLLFDKRAEKAANTVTRLAAATEAYNATSKAHIATTKDLTDSTAKYTNEVKKAGKETEKTGDKAKKASKDAMTFGKVWKGITATFGGITKGLRMFGMTLGIVSAGLGVVGLAGEAAKATQGTLGLIASLAHLSAFAALIPTGVGAMALSMMSLKLATHGVGQALQGVFSGQMTKAQIKDLKGLSDQAKGFIKIIAEYVPEFKKVKNAAQDAFFGPLNKGLKQAITSDLPLFKAGVVSIDTQFGQLGAQVLTFFAGMRGQRTIEDLFHAGESAVKAFGAAVGPVMNGLSDVIHAVSPMWDQLTQKFGNAGGEFGKWLTKISQSGQLTTWLNQAVIVAGQLWDIFKSVWGVFDGLIKAVGTDGLTSLGTMLRIVSEFMNSFTGQAAIQDFFKALGKDATAVAPLFTILAKALDTLGPAIDAIVQGLAPGLLDFLSKLVGAVGILAPMWGPLAQAVGDALVALEPLLPLLGQIIKVAGELAAGVLQELIAVLRPILMVIVPPLTKWFELLGNMLQQLEPVVTKVFQAFGDALTAAQPLITQFAAIFDTQMNVFLQQFIQFLIQATPQLVQLAQQFGAFLILAMQQLLPQMPQLINSFFLLLETMVQNAPLLLQLAQYALQFLIQITPLIPYLMKFAELLVQLGVWALQLLAVFVQFASGIISNALAIVDWFKGVWHGISDLISAPFLSANTVVMGIIDGIKSAIQGISKQAHDIGSFFSGLNPFKFAGGPVDAGQKYTVGEIGKELFVPNGGGMPQVIGAHGMETRSFATSGTIVPNYMLEMMDRFQAGMAASAARVGEPAMAGARSGGGGDTYHYALNLAVGNNVSEIDIAKIERNVLNAIEKARKDSAERRGE